MAFILKWHGRACPYCLRQMNRHSEALRPTRDHVIPKSQGGGIVIVCCFFCNNFKGNMHPELWDFFRKSYPEYWRMPRKTRNKAVMDAKREFVPSGAPLIIPNSPQRQQRTPVAVPAELIFRKN